MPDHPSPIELASYVRRRLPWRDVLRVDGHLQSCQQCSIKLADGAGSAASHSLLRVLDAAGSHLSYSQIESLLPLAPRTGKPEHWRHLEHCPSCRRELADLKAFAQNFSQPRTQPRPLVPGERLWSWLKNPLRLAAAGSVAAAVVVLLLPRTETIAPSHARRAFAEAPARAATVELDNCAFDALAGLAPRLQALYQAHEYSALAQALETSTQSGEPVAQSALGVMAARGWGMRRDLDSARTWLQRSAAQGDVCARRNLMALDNHG